MQKVSLCLENVLSESEEEIQYGFLPIKSLKKRRHTSSFKSESDPSERKLKSIKKHLSLK
jgi:hypothetical protein